MINKRFFILHLILFGHLSVSIFGQTISDKKANLSASDSDLDQETERFLIQVNRETQEIRARLQQLYEQVSCLYEEDAPPEQYQALLQQINEQKRYLNHLEQSWRDLVIRGNRNEGYGLWHAPETTLEQLIIDYGSQDYVYLIPPEVGSIKLSVNSNLPIPRAAWNEMLELILTQNGVGIRTLNPYLRQLYLIRQNLSHLRLITNNREDLEILPPSARVSFVLSPEPSEVRRTFAFLEKFINPNTTLLQVLGRDILVIGPAGDVLDLLRLNDFIVQNRGEKDYRLLPMFKMPAAEMARILEAIFDQSGDSKTLPQTAPLSPNSSAAFNRRPLLTQSTPPLDINGLKIIPLQNMPQALFVVGTREEVRKAEEIVRNVESQIGGARDKVVFWYTVRHSDAEELADVLFRIYNLMISTSTGFESSDSFDDEDGPDNVQNKVVVVDNNNLPGSDSGEDGSSSGPMPYQTGGYVINPAPAQPGLILPTVANNNRNNFIVDIKSGSIVMVVEADILPRIKDLLRKLDVPKRMVQIETLLFEKILNRENSIGLNLLRIGDAALNKTTTGAFFNNLFPKNAEKAVSGNAGVTEFFFSQRRNECGIPAFDLAYRFLLNQDDVQINSSPSILTINQTPATIAINEDISINTGVFEVENTRGNVALRDAFTRAQYGITISIKPTIHLAQCEEGSEYDYVTLETDITFDTINPSRHPDRPDVTRRHITNQVQIPDGDTVILGGLRRKVSNDRREAIPFLGELPGLGKLFSLNTIRDTNTEMYICLTPRIVKDPKEQLACLRQELLSIRPGDVPYFLECVQEAHRYEKTRLMEGSMTLLFGRPREHYYYSDFCPTYCCEEVMGEYDGR